jgi:hypothetical protein
MINEGNGAIFSDCLSYRYLLWRRWGSARMVLFVCLNPSIAGARHDDNTVRRCVAFATCARYGGLFIANLFAFVSTPVAGLFAAPRPEGNPANDRYLRFAMGHSRDVIVAWGRDGSYRQRDLAVLGLLLAHFPQIYCLDKRRVSGRIYPRHPLTLKASCTAIPFP